jgi:hypothetical protein
MTLQRLGDKTPHLGYAVTPSPLKSASSIQQTQKSFSMFCAERRADARYPGISRAVLPQALSGFRDILDS